MIYTCTIRWIHMMIMKRYHLIMIDDGHVDLIILIITMTLSQKASSSSPVIQGPTHAAGGGMGREPMFHKLKMTEALLHRTSLHHEYIPSFKLHLYFWILKLVAKDRSEELVLCKRMQRSCQFRHLIAGVETASAQFEVIRCYAMRRSAYPMPHRILELFGTRSQDERKGHYTKAGHFNLSLQCCQSLRSLPGLPQSSHGCQPGKLNTGQVWPGCIGKMGSTLYMSVMSILWLWCVILRWPSTHDRPIVLHLTRTFGMVSSLFLRKLPRDPIMISDMAFHSMSLGLGSATTPPRVAFKGTHTYAHKPNSCIALCSSVFVLTGYMLLIYHRAAHEDRERECRFLLVCKMKSMNFEFELV